MAFRPMGNGHTRTFPKGIGLEKIYAGGYWLFHQMSRGCGTGEHCRFKCKNISLGEYRHPLWNSKDTGLRQWAAVQEQENHRFLCEVGNSAKFFKCSPSRNQRTSRIIEQGHSWRAEKEIGGFQRKMGRRTTISTLGFPNNPSPIYWGNSFLTNLRHWSDNPTRSWLPYSKNLYGPSQFAASFPCVGSTIVPKFFLSTKSPISNSLGLTYFLRLLLKVCW